MQFGSCLDFFLTWIYPQAPTLVGLRMVKLSRSCPATELLILTNIGNIQDLQVRFWWSRSRRRSIKGRRSRSTTRGWIMSRGRSRSKSGNRGRKSWKLSRSMTPVKLG